MRREVMTMFQRFASVAQTFGRRADRGERAEGERRAGVNHVSASARQGNMPRPFKERHSSQLEATRLNREGISPCLCLDFGTWRSVQRTALEKRDCHHHYLIFLRWTMATSTVGISSDVKNAPSHFTRRHVNQLTVKGAHFKDESPGSYE